MGISPVATFEVTPDLAVTVSMKPAKGPPLSQFVEVVARRDDGQVVVELRGYAADPDFAGVTLPVGSLNARGGKLTVALEDLAPSLRDAS